MLRLSVLTVACFIATVAPASSNTLVTKLIRDAQPCSALKTSKKVLGRDVTIGVDKFKDLSVHDFNLRIEDDNVSSLIDLTLTCRTSSKALVTGDASARLEASLKATLGNCQIQAISARIKETGGRFGAVIDAFRSKIEGDLKEAGAEQFNRACSELHN